MAVFERRSMVGDAVATALTAGITNASTTMSVASVSGWPTGSVGPYYAVIDRNSPLEEQVKIASLSGTTLSFATSGRGANGTTAQAHLSGATVEFIGTTIDFDEANQLVFLMGNGAEGCLFYGKGAAVLPAKLAIGAASTILQSNGTDPVWSAPSNGYGITGFAATPPVPAVALTNSGAIIGANVTLPSNTPTTIIDTASLGIGTWEIIFDGLLLFDGTANAIITVDALVDTATASFSGPISTQIGQGTVVSNAESVSLAVIAVVTVAGTIKFIGTNTGAANAFALKLGQTGRGATGAYWKRIA